MPAQLEGHAYTVNALDIIKAIKPGKLDLPPVTDIVFIDDISGAQRPTADNFIRYGETSNIRVTQIPVFTNDTNKFLRPDAAKSPHILLFGGLWGGCIQAQLNNIIENLSQVSESSPVYITMPLPALCMSNNELIDITKYPAAELIAVASNKNELYYPGLWKNYESWSMSLPPEIKITIAKNGKVLRKINPAGKIAIFLNFIGSGAEIESFIRQDEGKRRESSLTPQDSSMLEEKSLMTVPTTETTPIPAQAATPLLVVGALVAIGAVTVEDRNKVTIEALKSEEDAKSRDPIAVVGLPYWISEELIKNNSSPDAYLASLEKESSRQFGQKGRGEANNVHKLKFFLMTKDAAETTTNLNNILSGIQTEQEIVVFTPQEISGTQIQIDNELINEKFKGHITVMPDGYTDIDASKGQGFPDVDARIAITRLVAWCKDAQAYNNEEAQRVSLEALTKYLGALSGEEIPMVKDLNELLRAIGLLKIRPVNYKDIVDWHNNYKAVAIML